MGRSSLPSLIVLVAACSLTPPSRTMVESGRAPVNLEVPARQGPPLRITGLRGRVVLLDVFASWCAPCRASLPYYAALSRKYGDNLAVVLVSADQERAALDRFLNEVAVELPVGHDPDGRVAEQLGVRVMPTLFFIGRDGKLRYRHESFDSADAAAIDTVVSELVAEPAPPAL